MSARTRGVDLAAALADAHKELARVKERHPATATGLALQQPGHPKAADADPDSTSSSSSWCDTHQRTLAVCATAQLRCVPLGAPPVSDPTGEAAVQPSKARDDLRSYEKLVAHLLRTIDKLRHVQDTYEHTVRPPGGLVQAEPGCWSCQRVGKWSPVYARGTVAGRLVEARALCTPCYRFVIKTGAAPKRADVQAFHRDGRWPSIRIKEGT